MQLVPANQGEKGGSALEWLGLGGLMVGEKKAWHEILVFQIGIAILVYYN